MLDSSLQVADTSRAASAPPRIHLASPADVSFIVDTIAAESKLGHFSCDCTQPDVLRGLWHQIQAIVSEGVAPMPGERNGVGARAFVIQVGQANAGFAILLEHAPGSWYQHIELFALVTHEGYRQRGLARHLVNNLVRDAQSAVVDARCAPASTAMQAMLQSCGFARVPAEPGRVALLEWRRDAVR